MYRLAAMLTLLVAFAFAVPVQAQQPADSVTLELLRRVVAMNGQPADVFVGKLPNVPLQVPLPKSRLIGSIVSHYQPAATTIQLFYDGDGAAFNAYVSSLETAGWSAATTPLDLLSHGFQGTPGAPMVMRAFCREGSSAVSVSLRSSRDLQVEMGQGPDAAGICNIHTVADLFAQTESPLPTLTAPQGESMTASSAGNPGGNSGALLVGSRSVADVSAHFAAQLTQSGWKARSEIASPQIYSQSFTMADNKGRKWQAMLTVYTVDGEPDSIIAFVDVTNLSNLVKSGIQVNVTQ